MYTLINGSGKKTSSNSKYFLNYIAKDLNEYNLFDLNKDSFDKILESINKSDAIILSFPLYVDTTNSLTTSFLDYIYDKKNKFK